jgi:hypothetical protein
LIIYSANFRKIAPAATTNVEPVSPIIAALPAPPAFAEPLGVAFV